VATTVRRVSTPIAQAIGDRPIILPTSPKKPMKSMLLAKSHIAEFVDDFGLVGNA
jgi:hypothetical protein